MEEPSLSHDIWKLPGGPQETSPGATKTQQFGGGRLEGVPAANKKSDAPWFLRFCSKNELIS